MNVHRIGGSCLGLCLVLAATATPGCLNLEKPHPAVTEAKVPLLKTWAKLTAEDGGMPKDNWIATFDDATLQALVIEALVNNRDVRVAAAFRDQSIALAQKAGAPLWPTLDLNAEGLKTFHNAGNNSTAMLLNLSCISWEVDVWGRVRYLTDAAEADVQVAQADLEFMRQSIASQVAQTYCQAIANKQHLANSQAMVVMQEEINRIHQAKLKEGQLGKMDWELSNSDLASFRADAQNRQSAYESSLRALEVLLGRYPSAEVTAAAAQPKFPQAIPAGLPSELLERRPDIIAAERTVAAAFFNTQSARANLLPKIALTADAGYASASLSHMVDSRNTVFRAGGSLAQPLFDGGQRLADIESAKAVQRQAIDQYAQTALAAFRDVQNGLANEAYYREQEVQFSKASASMEIALPLADKQYKAGTLSLLNFQQVQQQAYTAKDNYISAQFARVQQRIQLHQALGGAIPDAQPDVKPAAKPAPAVQPAATTKPAK